MSKRDSTPQNSGTVLALLGMLLAFGALVALAAMVLPAVAGFLAVIFGIFLFRVLHYLFMEMVARKTTPPERRNLSPPWNHNLFINRWASRIGQ